MEPEYVYKILVQSLPDPLPRIIPYLNDLDAHDGYVHLSTAQQVPSTTSRFFKDYNMVYILKISYPAIKTQVKWENTGNHGSFPHIYGDFVADSIVDQKSFTNNGKDWQHVLENEKWIE
ncbi:unnamed protein product [Didymodactylos carnosus]|uniref:Uncharacterized protein n=1 Tax=Didymodactylos carnosus TaxID=1234261 RepID=A0A814IE32_9BILA|nr:unnamed protein product [Didymodactylos carnosus]CAF1022214.1 unnamed protein product [Didymodactylos carnosus]CAF3784719.1 unnamed protein product [Didymodactylos carnosus]CAF3793635.1 unnamed protein product [Didymodactylos carnosus]